MTGLQGCGTAPGPPEALCLQVNLFGPLAVLLGPGLPAQLVSLTVIPSGSERFLSVCFSFLSSFLCTLFRLILYTPVSASSGLFHEEMFRQIHPQLCFSLPGLPVVLSQKALCVEQTDSNLHISLGTPTGLPGDQPSASLGAAV